MQSDALLPPSLPPPPTTPVVPTTFDKVRFRFRKGPELRLLSHHDLLRTFERLLRRAELPVRRTQGFHPHPRLVFALSLPLGVVGHEEVAELELDDVLPIDEICSRLGRQVPPGLEILSLRRVGMRASAQVRRLTYRITVPAARCEGLQETLTTTLAASECFVERDKPERKRVDIRPFISELRLFEGSGERGASAPRYGAGILNRGITPPARQVLDMTLWLTPAGTARPAEVLRVLGLEDLITEGSILERTLLELHDEVVEAPVGSV